MMLCAKKQQTLITIVIVTSMMLMTLYFSDSDFGKLYLITSENWGINLPVYLLFNTFLLGFLLIKPQHIIVK